LTNSCNRNLQMTLVTSIEDVDKLSSRWADTLLERKDKLSIEAPSVTCFGLVTCRVKGWQLKTWCVVEDNF
jgi:hypothetical protein